MNFKEANQIPNLDDYIRFDFANFFKNRILRLHRVISLHPFVIDCYISRDDSKDGVDNTGKHITVALSCGLPIQAGEILKAFYDAQKKGEKGEEITVMFDPNSRSRQSRYGKLDIITSQIHFVNRNKKVEIYEVPKEYLEKNIAKKQGSESNEKQ